MEVDESETKSGIGRTRGVVEGLCRGGRLSTASHGVLRSTVIVIHEKGVDVIGDLVDVSGRLRGTRDCLFRVSRRAVSGVLSREVKGLISLIRGGRKRTRVVVKAYG